MIVRRGIDRLSRRGKGQAGGEDSDGSSGVESSVMDGASQKEKMKGALLSMAKAQNVKTAKVKSPREKQQVS